MKSLLTIFIVTISFSFQVKAQKAHVFSDKQGALRGYDPVAYFNESKPVKGTKDFIYHWNGADWYFSNLENMETFKASPEKYAPQYGGYCAFGMSNGYKAPIDPQAWTIVEGKLYLNYNKEVQQSWNKNQNEFINKADENWPQVANKE